MTSSSTAAPAADRSNWRTAPHSRWAFHNVDALLPTAVISRGEEPPAPLETAPRSLPPVEVRRIGGASLDFEGFLEATETDACVVLHGGRIVFETYCHGNSRERPHILMSATKSVVGLLAGVLEGERVLRTEAPVSDYVTEIDAGPYRWATVRHLLDMRAGVVLTADEAAAYQAAANWDAVSPDAASPASLKAFFRSLAGPPGPHGGPFSYVSANTDLLGWVLERAAGQSFAALMSDRLWRPIGAEADAYVTLDAAGLARGTGGLCATVRDFARIGRLVARGGTALDRRVVPEAWIIDMEEGGDAEAWRAGSFAPAFAGARMRYRSGWYVIDDAPRTLFAMGIHGQSLFVDRVNDIVLAKASSMPSALDPRLTPLIHRGWHAVRRSLLAA